MATRARFGRLPRSAPSLTGTLVALAEQYQRTRDSNIEDAWKNGGLFEGKKVTDEMFLAHWKERLASIDPNDPMWDYYNNQIYGYEFLIEETKMGQKYAEESVTDGQMAAFYRKWAAKMPRDSQNYRLLMTQAAKFKSASAARSSGSRARAAADAYNNAQQASYNRYERPFDVAIQILAREAVVRGYLDQADLNDKDYGFSKLTNAEGENDPVNFAALLEDLTQNPEAVAAMTAAIRQYDPNFSGTFNKETLQQLAQNAQTGADIAANRAVKAGRSPSDANERAARYSTSAMVITASLGGDQTNGFVIENERQRARMDAVLAPTSGATPLQRKAAITAYESWLANVGAPVLVNSFPRGALDSTSPNFDPNAAGLVNRVQGTLNALNGKSTGLTLKDDFYGFSTAEAGESSDAVWLSQETASLSDSLSRVASGESLVVRTDRTGKPSPAGDTFAIFSRNDPELSGYSLIPVARPATGAMTFEDGTVLGGGNGEIINVVAKPIKTQAYSYVDPNTRQYTGELKPAEGSAADIGMMVTIPGPDGTEQDVFGIWTNGRLLWTTDSPFVDNVDVAKGGTDVVVRFQAPPTQQGASPRYDPQSVINRNSMIPTPATGRQNTFDSPMEAFLSSNDETMKYGATLGRGAIVTAQKEWFSNTDNWTDEMKQMAAIGVDPERIVEREGEKLYGQVEYARQYGYTREERDRTMAGMRQLAEARVSMTPERRAEVDAGMEQRAKARLVSQLDAWAMKPLSEPPDRTSVVVRPGFGPPTPATPKPSRTQGATLPQGWKIDELLGQPGMSLEYANDLAYRVSNGAVGAPITGDVSRVVSGTTPQRTVVKDQVRPARVNPFLPKTGQLGPTALAQQLGPAYAVQPKAAPAPSVVPKPTTSPTTSVTTAKVTSPKVEYKPARPTYNPVKI